MNASPIADGCPDQGKLAAFQLGNLPSETFDTIVEHLRGCRTCEAKMQALADPVDELVSSLRQLAGSELGPEDLDLDAEAFALELGSWSESAEQPIEVRLEQVREYRLLEKLGQGGMGTVFRAVHSRLGRTVALKILREQRRRSPDLVARFHRETKAVGMLDHPNIVRATDAGEWQGTDYLVMEFVEGMDVSKLVRRLGPVPVADACEIVRQAALGLAHAHERGMVHRDVKPSNLLLSRQGIVKLTDLGLVRGGAAEEVGPSTTSHYVLGSVEYMAPEQADDPHGAGPRADLYALGCTLYELLAGQPPFAGVAHRTVLQKLKAHASGPIPPLSARRADVAKDLGAIVEKLLAKNPGERMASASELAQALAPFTVGADLRQLLEEAEHAPPTSNWTTRLAEATARGSQVPKRRLWRLAGVLIAAASVLFAGLVLYVQTDQGVIEVVTSDDDVKISIERGGKVIEIMDLQKKKTYRLDSGGYELKIVAGEQDFEIKPQSLTLKRGKTEIVRIRRLDNQPFVRVPWPPLDKAWLDKVAQLSPKERANEIVKELSRRNPGFDGTGVNVKLEEGKLTLVFTQGSNLLDLMPLRAAPELRSLGIINGAVADLSPLAGLPLTGLDLMNTKAADLTPLKGMSLKYVNLNGSGGIKDLTPLIRQPIEILDVSGTSISDLTPLALLPELLVFSCAGTKVSDLEPLRRVKNLTVLNCDDLKVSNLEPIAHLTRLHHLEVANSKVKDLRPLAKLPLKYLNIKNALVTDLSPLRDLTTLEKLVCDFDASRDGAVLRSLEKLVEINGKPKGELLP